MNRKIDFLLFGLAGAFGLYVALRAWLLPITVDESSTVINHVSRLVVDTLFYEREANPNNHILNTLLIKTFAGIFGWHPFVVRLPALLGALAYAWAGYLLCQQISAARWVRVFAYALLLGQPFLLEFFSLARGYGLALGLMLAAIWQAWRFLKESRWESLRPALVFAGLAVYANFTQLIFFGPFVALLFFSAWQLRPSRADFWQKSKPAFTALGIFIALWITPLSRLSRDREIVNWNELGSMFEAVKEAVHAATFGNAYFGPENDLILCWLITAFFFGISAAGLWRWVKSRARFAADPRLFLTALLFSVALANFLQVQLTQTPYLEPRLSLLYWPLFALSLGAAGAWIWERWTKRSWVFMAPLLIFTGLNIARCVNLRETHEWWPDKHTYTVLEFLKDLQQKEGRKEPYGLDTYWILQNSFMFHLERDPRGFDQVAKLGGWHGIRPASRDFEFYYAIHPEDAAPILDAYNIVLRLPDSPMLLLRKK